NIEVIRVDGGMSRNPTFVQALANFTGMNVEVSPHAEGTTVGAGRLALVGLNQIAQVAETADLWDPQIIIRPEDSFDRVGARTQWEKATSRSLGWIPELSSLDF
ncbi:MAG: FGGY-family carbohydrate kinase, partial [Ilumatobacteraceae bacterium]